MCLKVRGKKSKYKPKKENVAKYDKTYREKNYHKKKARAIAYRLKTTGQLKMEPCAKCGKKIAESHHPDYKRPGHVIWLCRKHHMELHRKYQ
jgi:hypothetical protein